MRGGPHREEEEYGGDVLTALLFGLAASSALVIGAVAGAYWSPPKPLLAAALAFASGEGAEPRSERSWWRRWFGFE